MLSVITEGNRLRWKPLHAYYIFPAVGKSRSEERLWRPVSSFIYLIYFIFFTEFTEAEIILSRLPSTDLYTNMFITFLPCSSFSLQIAYFTVLILKSPKWFQELKTRKLEELCSFLETLGTLPLPFPACRGCLYCPLPLPPTLYY